ncbi:unnamed protein product [Parnassius mnemosyne]|uniref:Gustatory receptor n=1 Tax=Parnassius mnemosyne TaxID=213953 RepID=A0AAV1KEU0_9NEOP
MTSVDVERSFSLCTHKLVGVVKILSGKMRHKQNNSHKYLCEKNIMCMRPLLAIEYFYGIFRFPINDFFLHVDIRIKLLSLLISSTWVTSYFVFCFAPLTRPVMATTADFVDETGWIIIAIQYLMTMLILVLFKNKTNKIIVEKFAEIDCALQTIINDDFYSESRKDANKLTILYFVSCILLTVFAITLERDFPIQYLIYLVIYFERKIEVFMFCHIISMLRQRILVINSYFEHFFKNRRTAEESAINNQAWAKGSIKFIGQVSLKKLKMQKLVSAYNNVGELCYSINSVSNVFLLMTFISAFIYIICTFWSSLYYLKSNKSFTSLLRVIVFSSAELVSISSISFYCESILVAKNRLKVYLNKTINDYSLPKHTRMQAKSFLEVTLVWPLHIFVFDMFPVNLKLILDFISVCTSYLVIVVQISHLM